MAAKTTHQSTADRDATAEAVRRALPARSGGEWATTRAVADATRLPYSTITQHLRMLADAGRAESTKDGRSTVWRQLGKAGPALRGGDVVTAKATTIKSASAKKTTGRSRRAESAEEMEAHARADGAQAAEDVTTPEPVWVAVPRKGVTYHDPVSGRSTRCGRSTRTGRTFPSAAAVMARHDAKPCPKCFAPDERPVGASGSDGVTELPAAARTPDGGGLGAVRGWMEDVRPVSPAPPAEPGARRTRRDPDGPRPDFAVWQPGKLQEAIVAAAQEMPDGSVFGPNQMARGLNSQAGSVTWAINRLVSLGNLVRVTDKPPRFRAA